ncbi:MAG: type IV pilin N-terminal domain-containing protein [Methanospirillaceae archaeon]|nr:type IV pilin N-terminal domain-containing protein [Methanospirillaceae archaeon]
MKLNRWNDEAVSPVVGIMLMLVVTLILAAIIGGMTGNMAQTQKKPPQLVIEAKCVNDGGTGGPDSFLDLSVLSVSEGIKTGDLKILTEWESGSGASNRTMVTGGIPNAGERTYPLGSGPGVFDDSKRDFGNYTLIAGTRMNVNRTYSDDGMNVMLGDNWKSLQTGDTVRIQVVHIPGGAIIVDKEITVEE